MLAFGIVFAGELTRSTATRTCPSRYGLGSYAPQVCPRYRQLKHNDVFIAVPLFSFFPGSLVPLIKKIIETQHGVVQYYPSQIHLCQPRRGCYLEKLATVSPKPPPPPASAFPLKTPESSTEGTYSVASPQGWSAPAVNGSGQPNPRPRGTTIIQPRSTPYCTSMYRLIAWSSPQAETYFRNPFFLFLF